MSREFNFGLMRIIGEYIEYGKRWNQEHQNILCKNIKEHIKEVFFIDSIVIFNDDHLGEKLTIMNVEGINGIDLEHLLSGSRMYESVKKINLYIIRNRSIARLNKMLRFPDESIIFLPKPKYNRTHNGKDELIQSDTDEIRFEFGNLFFIEKERLNKYKKINNKLNDFKTFFEGKFEKDLKEIEDYSDSKMRLRINAEIIVDLNSVFNKDESEEKVNEYFGKFFGK